MNRYKHKFVFKEFDGSIHPAEGKVLLVIDFCFYCGKSVNLMHGFSNIGTMFNLDRQSAEDEMNLLHPCLTEDEYTIKGLVE